MEIIYSNIIENSFISELNAEINKISYEKSMWLFEVDNHMLFSKIRTYLTNHPKIRKYIRDDTYIVIRCVKNTDKHRQKCLGKTEQARYVHYWFFSPMQNCCVRRPS